MLDAGCRKQKTEIAFVNFVTCSSCRVDWIPEFDMTSGRQFVRMESMSKADIIAELPRLTPADRQEIRLTLAKLDGEAWLDVAEALTDAEKALLDARLAAYAKDPEAGSSWEEVEGRIRARLKK